MLVRPTLHLATIHDNTTGCDLEKFYPPGDGVRCAACWARVPSAYSNGCVAKAGRRRRCRSCCEGQRKTFCASVLAIMVVSPLGRICLFVGIVGLPSSTGAPIDSKTQRPI